MREILFRARKTGTNEWIEGFVSSPCKNTMCTFVDTQEAVTWYVDEDTVGQYTGLTDKNGKKIFEGDIVRYPDSEMFASCEEAASEGFVDWDEEVMCFYFTNRFVVDMADFDIENGKMVDVEVIGNIHDNPELLKGGGE